MIFGLSFQIVMASDNYNNEENITIVVKEADKPCMIKAVTIMAMLRLHLKYEPSPEEGNLLDAQMIHIDADYCYARLNKNGKHEISDTLGMMKSLLVKKYGYSPSDFVNQDQLSPAKSTASSPFQFLPSNSSSPLSTSSSPYSISGSPSTVLSSEGSSKKNYFKFRDFSPINSYKKNN